MRPFCPLEYYKTEPFISLPLLTALKSNSIDDEHSNNKRSYELSDFGNNNNNNSISIESRSNDAVLETHDFTREHHRNNTELEDDIRWASFGLIARNIFKDVVVRPFQSFSKFFQTAQHIWDKGDKQT